MSVQLIDIPKVPDVDRTWLGSTRIKPTNALPKQTLFGTSLQQREVNLVEGLRSINLKFESGKRPPRSVKSKTRSPKLAAIFGQGEQILEHSKDQVAQRQLQISRAENLLQNVEEKAKYFQLESAADPREIPWERSKGNQKMTESDLKHSSAINDVGLNEGSYNHQKYRQRPPVHQYSIAGDPLGVGNDFSSISDKPNHLVPPMQPFKRHRDPFAVPKEAYMKHNSDTVVAGTAVTIPANIRHKFGTVICEELFADPEKVKSSISRQDQDRRRLMKPSKIAEKVKLPPQELDPEYDEIGTSTRANIFGPGITRNHKIGTMKEDFSDKIHKRRVPETDEYRYQRDELSLWWQHETIRGRMKKKWDEYEESKPKFTVNWDRDAKRPPPPPKPVEKKPKPKPKPKPKEPTPQPVDDIVFEDIEFVTPPLTPPPQREPPPTKVIENDDFWDFYNQEVPLP